MVEPTFDPDMLTVVIDFPAVQAALAKCMTTPEATVAKRFEIYSGGLELANGYDEECDPDVLKGILATTDIALLRAFQATAMTACTGVALGVDRLLMLATASASIAEVVSFDYQAV